MQKKFKCKTPQCNEYVTLELKGGVGAFLANDLDRHITMSNDKMEINSTVLPDNEKLSHKLNFNSQDNSTLSLNIRKGYTAEALLKCSNGHENYYTIEVN